MRLLFKSGPDYRYYKEGQLLFQFDVDLERGTRCPQRVNKTFPRKLSGLDITSSSEKPVHQCGRDHALEEKSRTLLRALGAAKLAHEIRVEWNPRLQTAAGRADFREKLISLNPRLRDLNDRVARTELSADKLDCLKQSSLTSVSESIPKKSRRRGAVHDEVDRTLRHELAHLLAQFREKRRRRIAPHGPEWREACRDLGIADETRCHNLPFATKVYPRRFVYCCPNCRREFPRVRKIQRAIACLACCRKHNGGDFDPCFRLELVDRVVPTRC